MINFIINLFESDKQALALYIQAFATIAIGLLAWTATRGQNIIAEKSARKELFKLRYQNIYQEANQLCLDCIELVNAYDIARDIKAKKNKEYRLVEIKNKYFQITKSFTDKMEANKYLIKLKDFDKLNSFCDKYISHVRDYIDGKCEDKMCRNHDVVTCFNEHYEVIPQILSSYLYHENES